MTLESIKDQIEIITRYNKYIEEWLNDPSSTNLSIEDLRRVQASNNRQLDYFRKILKNREK